LYKYILFDWDGTLSHTLPVWLEAHRITLEKFNVSISDQDVIDKMLVSPHGLKEFNVDRSKYFIELIKYSEIHYEKLELHNEVLETLEELKKRTKKIVIVTSMWKRFVLNTLNILNLEHLFDEIICHEDVTMLKPNAEPIEKAIEKLHATKEETLMVGDSDVDILSAKNAGVTSVWFHPQENWKFYPHGHFDHLKPNFTIRSMKELLEIVK
jgi:pyrophosphatase PpaX